MDSRHECPPLSISRNTVSNILSQAKNTGLSVGSNLGDIAAARPLLQEAQQVIAKVKGVKVENHISQYHSQLEAWFVMPHMTVNQMVRLLQKDNKRISETQLRRYVKKHFPQYKHDNHVSLSQLNDAAIICLL